MPAIGDGTSARGRERHEVARRLFARGRSLCLSPFAAWRSQAALRALASLCGSSSKPNFDVSICVNYKCSKRRVVHKSVRSYLDVTHEATCTLKQPGGIGQDCAKEKADVDMGRECVDVAECKVCNTCRGVSIICLLYTSDAADE